MRIESSVYFAKLEPGRFYHVYNRTNNKELLFGRLENDESRFLDGLVKYLSPFVDLYSFSLLPNHFHLVIQVKSIEEINRSIMLMPRRLWRKSFSDLAMFPYESQDIHGIVSRAFSILFSSYAKQSNLMWGREGNLFNQQFKRKLIDGAGHLTDVIEYVNLNAVKHGLVSHPKDHLWSSYNMILSRCDDWLACPSIEAKYGPRELFKTRCDLMSEMLKSVKVTPRVDLTFTKKTSHFV